MWRERRTAYLWFPYYVWNICIDLVKCEIGLMAEGFSTDCHFFLLILQKRATSSTVKDPVSSFCRAHVRIMLNVLAIFFFFCLVILHKHCYCKHKDIERSLPVMCFIVKVTTAAYRMQRRLSPTTTSCFTWAPWVTSALARSEWGWLNMGYTPPKVVWCSFTKALVVRMRLSDKTEEAYFSVCARCNVEWIFFLQISYFCAHKFSMKLGLNCVKNILFY